MLFNSIDFAIYLPIVFFIYWFVVNNSIKVQNLFIVIASFIFYGWWDWRFLVLISISIIFDYCIGRALMHQENQTKRKLLLWISISVSLGLLAFFKYFNFFIESFETVFSFFGREISHTSLNIILPVGISFYTFQTMSYAIDVYKRKVEPTRDFIAFAAFVSFFPQLVAGPIERAADLLPQFYQKRIFDYSKAVDGSRQILWGLFKKIVIADNCAVYTNEIFNNSDSYSGIVLILGAVFFTFQAYGDFSGYSDIAIGTARLFSFNLTQNFAFPFFSRSIVEFWRRWHISLSSWFRDYLYIPLGGNRRGRWINLRNIFIVFIICGFWHGASWTYIVWGALNAVVFIPLILFKRKSRKDTEIVTQGKNIPTIKEVFSMVITFGFVVFSWGFFRAESMEHALQYFRDAIAGLFNKNGYVQMLDLFSGKIGFVIPSLIILFMLIEWFGRENKFAIEKLLVKKKAPLRYLFYFTLIILMFIFGGEKQQFIYFQF